MMTHADSPPLLQPPSRRFAGLDALRGFAILTMVLSGTVPHGMLPAWMYHCQTPPPTHKFDPNVPGITWVDLVFPFFLFALGAAIPFALRRRIEKGMPVGQAALTILKRGALLFFFAVYQQHIVPYVIKPEPDTHAWLCGLIGFALFFPMMMRFPDRWKPATHWTLRAAGWAGAIALLAHLRYPDGTGFSIYRSNIILMLLMVSAVFGSLAWLFTRDNLPLRLGVLGILMAHRLANGHPGWVNWIDNLVSISKVWGPGYAHYLFIVIPGTIAGDMMLAWIRGRDGNDAGPKWSVARYGTVVALMTAFILVNLAGLKARWIPATVVVNAAMCLAGWFILSKPQNPTERLLTSLYRWGFYWLVLGLAFEPYEGGIKKDPNTMSYFFVTTGLALFLVIAFTVVLDVWKVKFGARLLVDNGQNPMIAYVGMANFIQPVLALLGIGAWIDRITPGAWLGTLRAILLTLLLGFVVSAFTRMKVFWRT
jgi:predicted acyltransferase